MKNMESEEVAYFEKDQGAQKEAVKKYRTGEEGDASQKDGLRCII